MKDTNQLSNTQPTVQPTVQPVALPEDTQQQAEMLLALIRELALELHPQMGQLQVSLTHSLEQELGFDSLSRIELLTRIEQRFGLTLSEQALATAESPQDLLRALAAAAPASKKREKALKEVEALADAEPAPDKAQTLVEVLDWMVSNHPDRPHVYYYGEKDDPHVLTYRGLMEGAEAVAAGLIDRGFAPGQTVAIMLPTCLEYFYSFFGVLLVGGTPVPIYPPARPSQIEDHLKRHAKILENAGTSVLITVQQAKIAARLLKMQVASLEHIVTPDELAMPGVEVVRPPLNPQDIAHLQYTSGSTGNPKGVVLTHANLLANDRAMVSAVQGDSTDVFVSWLPLYHDMGLIGAWLGSLYAAMPLVLMSPLSFLAHPHRWLWMIHKHRGTISGGPNFAFELLLRRVKDEQIEGLDLSSWRVVFNGAEPVIPETMRRFKERFAPYGLHGEGISAVYGLAECSVGLAFPPVGRGLVVDKIKRESFMNNGKAVPTDEADANALEFPACGQPLPGHEIRIVNDAGVELGEREEGRLQFRGPSAMSGYYHNLEATKAVMFGDWIDSGDQAYMVGGDVYLTGRRKDIIIRAGRNIYPHEVEEAIGNLEGVRKGCVAVFGTEDKASGTERLVALVESREKDHATHDDIAKRIQSVAVDLLGNPLDDVMVVLPHTVPKTSSGKIRRASSREVYEKGVSVVRQRSVWMQVLRLTLSGLLPQLRRYRRLSGDRLYGAWWVMMLALLAPPVWLGVALVPSVRWSWAVVRLGCRLQFWLTGTRLDVKGQEHLPKGTPHIMVANHSSYMDGLALIASLPHHRRFIAKRELLGKFFVRIFLKHLGIYFVERFDKQRGVADARRLAKSAEAGESLIIFPEGTFRRSPGLMPFHMGGFQAAVDAGVPVVPVVIRGTRSILRDGQLIPRRGRINLSILAPISPEGEGWNAALELRDKARADMLRLVGEPDLAGSMANSLGALGPK